MQKRRILVTAALPYANSELHIGHARSTYIPADIYVRYHRLRGNEVYYICGTDEHGTPISVMAEKLGVKPKEITDKIYVRDVEDFKRLNISFDNFSRTTRPIHYETTQWFFRRLYEGGLIYAKTIELPYCQKCGRYLPDRYVYGACSYCGFEDARGDECDVCGRALTIGELVNPKCAVCDSPAVNKESRHWFLKLSHFQEWLLNWIKGEEGLLPVMGKNYLINQYLEPGLEDVCISRDLNWGVPIPLEEAEGKVCYVWFDAPIGYVDSSKELFAGLGNPEGWRDFWQGENTELIHFIGKGILYHHALFWPAVLKGAGYRSPTVIAAFSYGNLEGRKMSKSRGWYLSLRDFLDSFEADSLRYYWIVASPLSEDADFVFEDFSKRYNGELADTLGNFVHRVLVFCQKNFDSSVPLIDDIEGEKTVSEHVENTVSSVEKSIEGFEFREGLLSIIALARFGNKFFNDNAPWQTFKSNVSKAANTIGLCLRIVKAISILIGPYLPETSRKMFKMLNLQTDEVGWGDILEPLPEKHLITQPEPLFLKIEDEKVSGWKDRLGKLREGEAPVLKEVSATDVSGLELIVGRIVSVKPVMDKKGYFDLDVKLGGDRTIHVRELLADNYTVSSLRNMSVIAATGVQGNQNKLGGEKGMLLKIRAASGYKLVTLDRDIEVGSKIC